MTDDYTPTAEEVLGDEIARVRHGQDVTASDLANRLMPWLAAHDAEKRTEWEAAVFECPNRLMDVAPPTPDPKETP